MTIIEAVTHVLKESGRPMSPNEVLSEIQRTNLYPFKTKDPLGVIRAQMRRHCEGYNRPTASVTPSLRKVGRDAFTLA